jgi:hypothetical protein
MSPIVTFDLGDRRDVSGAKRCSFSGENDKQQGENQERIAPTRSEPRHDVDCVYQKKKKNNRKPWLRCRMRFDDGSFPGSRSQAAGMKIESQV